MKKVFEVIRNYEIDNIGFKVTLLVETDYKGSLPESTDKVSKMTDGEARLSVQAVPPVIIGLAEITTKLEKNIILKLEHEESTLFEEDQLQGVG